MNYDVVEVVIDKLVRDFGLKEWQFDIEDLVEDVAEAIKLIGAKKVYAEKVAQITVTNKVAPLPRDCENIKHLEPNSMPYRESGSFLEVDLADGEEITLVYQAVPTDTRGYILVPDSAPVREAVVWFLAKKLALRGVIKVVGYAGAESEWQWRCGSARAYLNAMSLQEVQNAYNDYVRLNPIKDQYYKGFAGVGKRNTLDREKANNRYRI